MNTILPVSFTFAGTTIDSGPVIQYLYNSDFVSLKAAMKRGESQLVLDTLNRAEFVSLYLKEYVAGSSKTLHRTFEEIRSFVACYPDVAQAMIKMVIIRIRRDFLGNEWYELMPRFEKAVAKIEKLLHPNP